MDYYHMMGDVLLFGNSIDLANIRILMRQNDVKIPDKNYQLKLIFYAECRVAYEKSLNKIYNSRISFADYDSCKQDVYDRWYNLI